MADIIKFPPRKAIKVPPKAEVHRVSHRGHHGRAKIITSDQFETALAKCEEKSVFSTRDRLMLLLSHYAALRAQEIAWLEYEDISDVTGEIVASIHVTKKAGKYGKERTIPMHPAIHVAIAEYCAQAGITEGPIFYGRFGVQMTPNAVQKQLKAIYVACGFKGATSHSGRRGFITKLARTAGSANCSLKDVQLLAGHASLKTTETYIDASPNASALVASL
jgi:integrase/recombinase XerD